jgi:transposase InsO family protein
LAVAQIDHTPMDVIVVDEEHRQPIQRPSLTVVIEVYSRMVLGFSIYPRLVVANNVERSVAPNLAKITASRI